MATYSQAKPAGTPTWIELTTPDIEAARTFYRAVFGWEYDIGAPEYGSYTTALLEQRMVAGMFGPQPDDPPQPTAWGLYFASDNIEADVARAVELGAKVLSSAMSVGEFGSMAVCEDPTGAAFSFWQAGSHVGSQVTEEPGSAAWYELYSSNAKQARDFYTAVLGVTADQYQEDWSITCSNMGSNRSVTSYKSIPRGATSTHSGLPTSQSPMLTTR